MTEADVAMACSASEFEALRRPTREVTGALCSTTPP